MHTVACFLFMRIKTTNNAQKNRFKTCHYGHIYKCLSTHVSHTLVHISMPEKLCNRNEKKYWMIMFRRIQILQNHAKTIDILERSKTILRNDNRSFYELMQFSIISLMLKPNVSVTQIYESEICHMSVSSWC